MRPLVLAAAASAVLSALSAAFDAPPSAAPPARGAQQGARLVPRTPCPPRTVPDGAACVPLPPSPAVAAGPASPAPRPRGVDRKARATAPAHIPRRPDRPAEYAEYRYPVGAAGAPPPVQSGYDLDRPAADQRHGPGFAEAGHGGIDLGAERGTEVRLVGLEHQEGDAQVIHAGDLFGTTVATLHAVREPGRLRSYIVLHGHLERVAPGVVPGGRLAPGAVVGRVGDTGSPGNVHLHLEVRQVRDGVDAAQLEPRRLVDPSATIVCDPRNVLPVAPKR